MNSFTVSASSTTSSSPTMHHCFRLKTASNATASSLPTTKSFTVTTTNGLCVTVSNDVIGCDGPDCDKAPTLRCSSCKRRYYCSKDCQRRDWKQHKGLCKKTKAFLTVKLPALRAKALEYQPGQVTSKECGICLAENMTRPLTLLETCSHAFCYPCLKKWDNTCNRVHGKTNCPLCRSPFDLRSTAFENWTQSIAVARLQQDPNVKRAIYEKALEDFDQTVGHEDKDFELYVAAQMTKATMCNKMGDAALAKKTMEKKVLCLTIPSFDTWTKAKLTHAESLIGVGLYYSALREVGQISRDCASDDIQLRILMANCRCWYELGNWILCIQAGMKIMSFDKHSPGIHKYLALGFKQVGNMSAAIMTMGQSILYEVDEGTGEMDENIRIFHKLKADEKTFRPVKLDVCSSPPKYSTPRCEFCFAKVVDKKDIQFRICQHAFCFKCMKKWWLDLVKKSPLNMPVRYKGEQSSCPICRKDIEDLPYSKRRSFVCNPFEFCAEPFSSTPTSS